MECGRGFGKLATKEAMALSVEKSKNKSWHSLGFGQMTKFF
jgi:hypothetical protein